MDIRTAKVLNKPASNDPTPPTQPPNNQKDYRSNSNFPTALAIDESIEDQLWRGFQARTVNILEGGDLSNCGIQTAMQDSYHNQNLISG